MQKSFSNGLPMYANLLVLYASVVVFGYAIRQDVTWAIILAVLVFAGTLVIQFFVRGFMGLDVFSKSITMSNVPSTGFVSSVVACILLLFAGLWGSFWWVAAFGMAVLAMYQYITFTAGKTSQ